jgi:MFS family permease
VLELPSGAWADAVSRRRLLAVAPLLSGAGFAGWVLAPSYEVFALGFVLWGVQGALTSGAFEALVYEELDRVGAAERYPTLIGRATALGTAAAAAAIALAAPVLAWGGLGAVTVASVLACVAAALVGATLPEHRARRDADHAGEQARAMADVLREALAELRASRTVRAALVAVPAVTAIWGSLDEYLPLLAHETGLTAPQVAVAYGIVSAAAALGGVLAGRAARLPARRLAALLAAGALALAAGALLRVPAGLLLIGVAFGAFQALSIVADTRLQDAIEGSARSTLTSVASLATELLVIAVFAAYAAGSAVADHAILFAGFAAVYFVVAAPLARSRVGITDGGPAAGSH